MPSGRKQDLNTATQQQLMSVPNIGPKLSAALLARRPFHDWASVQSIPGLGPKRIANLSSAFCLEPHVGVQSESKKAEWHMCSLAADGSYSAAVSDTSGMPDLNRASVEDLQQVPGIGFKLASAVCACRPFATWDDVEEVPLIGPQRLAALKSQFCLRSDHRSLPQQVADASWLAFRTRADDTYKQCFLPDIAFKGLDGAAVRVYNLRKGNFVCSSVGERMEVIHFRKLPNMPYAIVTLQAAEIELRVPSAHRIVVPRGGAMSAVAARELKIGDEVCCNENTRTALIAVSPGTCEVELYEIEFSPNHDLEPFTLQQLPEKTILTRSCSKGRTRRGGAGSQRQNRPAARTPSPTCQSR